MQQSSDFSSEVWNDQQPLQNYQNIPVAQPSWDFYSLNSLDLSYQRFFEQPVSNDQTIHPPRAKSYPDTSSCYTDQFNTAPLYNPQVEDFNFPIATNFNIPFQLQVEQLSIAPPVYSEFPASPISSQHSNSSTASSPITPGDQFPVSPTSLQSNSSAESSPVTPSNQFPTSPTSSQDSNSSTASSPTTPNNPSQPRDSSSASRFPGRQRYKCAHSSGCTRTFARTSDRDRHWQSVHSGIRYRCFVIGCTDNRKRGYCRLEKLKAHLRKRHGLVLGPGGILCHE